MNNESKNNSILVVDDNPKNLSVLYKYLDDYGYKILIKENAESVLEQIEKIQPDLILLDILMPGMDGIELCKKIKINKNTKDIPIIFMTALSNTEDKIKGFKAGAVDYITKPLHHEEVLARVHTHLTLRNTQKQLIELNENKNKFFSIIAHDLKGSLGSLINICEFLNAKDFDVGFKDQKHFIKLLYNGTKQLYSLLENLLQWASLQMDGVKYHPDKYNIYKTIKDVLKNLYNIAESKNIEIINYSNEDVIANFDEDMIKLVVRNLINNAIKFTKRGGRIIIDQKIINNQVEISISDNGIGMDKNEVAKLFKIGKKHSKPGTEDEKGTGLGLILCNEFIKLHKSELIIDSKVNEGSTFKFKLPL